MTKGPRPSLFDLLADYPPPYVRLLAKLPGGGRSLLAISDAELAISSGISLTRIREIAYSLNWEDIKFGEIRAFLSACHFDRTYQTPQQRLEQQVQDSYAESARQRKLLNSVMIQTLRARGYTIPAGVE